MSHQWTFLGSSIAASSTRQAIESAEILPGSAEAIDRSAEAADSSNDGSADADDAADGYSTA